MHKPTANPSLSASTAVRAPAESPASTDTTPPSVIEERTLKPGTYAVFRRADDGTVRVAYDPSQLSRERLGVLLMFVGERGHEVPGFVEIAGIIATSPDPVGAAVRLLDLIAEEKAGDAR